MSILKNDERRVWSEDGMEWIVIKDGTKIGDTVEYGKQKYTITKRGDSMTCRKKQK